MQITIVSSVILFIVCPACLAGIVLPRGSQNIDETFRTSDVVCIGRVVSVTTRSQELVRSGTGTVVRNEKSALVQVDRTYKGDNGSQQVSIDLTVEDPDFNQVTWVEQGEYLLLFLVSKPGSKLTLADKFFPKFPVSPPAPGPAIEGPDALQNDMAGVLTQSRTPTAASNAMYVLMGFNTLLPLAVEALEKRTSDPDADVALTSLGVLLKTHEPKRIKAFADGLKALANNLPPQAGSFLFRFSGELLRVTRPDALPELEAVMDLPFPDLRHCSLQSIWKLHLKSSVPFLVSRLDDPYPPVQETAAIALGEIANKPDLRPVGIEFRDNPQKYLEGWKAWWRTEGKLIYASAGSAAVAR